MIWAILCLLAICIASSTAEGRAEASLAIKPYERFFWYANAVLIGLVILASL